MKINLSKLGWSVVSIAILIAIWQIISLFVSRVVLPKPYESAIALYKLTVNGDIPKAVLETLIPLIIAFLLAVIVGVTIGIIVGVSQSSSRIIDPWVYILWCTPEIALLPLMIVWFGIGLAAQIVFIFLAAVFPVIMNTKTGVRQVEQNLIEVAHSLGANRKEIITQVVFPSVTSYILAGARIAVGRSVVAVIISQLFISATGIGYMLQYYGDTLRLAEYFAPLVVTAIIGIVMNVLANHFEKKLVPWKPEAFK